MKAWGTSRLILIAASGHTDLPPAAAFGITVAALPNPSCPGVAGGYSFDAAVPTPPSESITYGNFPAMGNGSSSACVFSAIDVIVRDKSNVVLVQKDVRATIELGKDNPTTITIP